MKYALIALLILSQPGCFYGCRAISDAKQVAYEEFGPRAALQKYEWFKDCAAKLDAKSADIKVYDARSAALRQSYEGTPYKDWDRKDKEALTLWSSEVAGLKASYNELASEYNAAMAKINWAYAEVGSLPPGATTPLPRSFKPYLEN